MIHGRDQLRPCRMSTHQGGYSGLFHGFYTIDGETYAFVETGNGAVCRTHMKLYDLTFTDVQPPPTTLAEARARDGIDRSCM